jgi:hypothetical protein
MSRQEPQWPALVVARAHRVPSFAAPQPGVIGREHLTVDDAADCLAVDTIARWRGYHARQIALDGNNLNALIAFWA